MDRFDDMAMFQIIHRTGTISAAAAELDVAPSAVSRRLKALEQRLGVQLVQRTTRRLTLTSTGEAYLNGSSHILSALDELEGTLQAGAGTLSGSIRLTVPLSFGLCSLPNIIDGFMRAHPEVELDLDLSDAQIDLVAQGVDLALRIGQLENSTLMARRLCAIDFALCASPAFLDQHSEFQHPKDLSNLPACVYTNDTQGTILKWQGPEGEKGHITLRSVVRANNGDILRDLAVRGHGLVMAPRFILEGELKKGRLREIFPDYRWADSNLYAVYPPLTHMPARLRALIDYLAAALKD
ncbi:MAG: LysR family transcriptional regulator [Pseudomonadota bacterium]